MTKEVADRLDKIEPSPGARSTQTWALIQKALGDSAESISVYDFTCLSIEWIAVQFQDQPFLIDATKELVKRFYYAHYHRAAEVEASAGGEGSSISGASGTIPESSHEGG